MPQRAELFVPGRLCLFGEHSDWAAAYRRDDPDIPPGHCLVAGTDQGLWATAERADDVLEIASALPDGTSAGPECIPVAPAALLRVAGGSGFFSYAAATLAELRVRHPEVAGMRLTVRSNLPVQKGLSSSAAICVLVARAASRLYGLDIDIEQEMDLAYAGERRTGSACGRMDQICAFGRGPVSLRIDGDALRFDRVATGGPLHLLIVDLCRGKDTRRILSDLNACFPAASGPLAEGVRDALGPRNVQILRRAEQLIGQGDGRALGELMIEAQAVFDALVAPACPELAAPRLHEVLAHPAVRELGWGGKGVGSQGDGCAQLVARGADERAALDAALTRALGVRCLPLTLEAQA